MDIMSAVRFSAGHNVIKTTHNVRTHEKQLFKYRTPTYYVINRTVCALYSR